MPAMSDPNHAPAAQPQEDEHASAGQDDHGHDEHGHDERPAHEDHLPADETGEIPTSRQSQRARPDTSAGERCDVADGLPAERHQAVQRPDVVVLQPVPGAG